MGTGYICLSPAWPHFQATRRPLRGEAGPALLDTYDEERRPVARAVSEIAGKMNDERGLMKGKGGLGALWNLRRAFPYFVVGYGYASRAVVLEKGAVPGPGTSELKGRPGTRAPHVWLSRDGQRVSTLDLFGKGFVLLVGPGGRPWSEAGRAVAQRLGLRLEVLPLGGRLDDPDYRWPRAFGVRSDGAVLVRPDGFVAWRARQAQPQAEEILTRLFGELLARAPGAAASPGSLGIATARGAATTSFR